MKALEQFIESLMYKDMKYQKEPITDILCEGKYKGYNFYIISFGNYPCAYVEIPKEHYLYNKYYDEIDITVHGGLTYSSNHLQTIRENTWILGWDYAHLGDYIEYELDYLSKLGEHKYTTKEILNDITSVIDQIIEKYEVKND